MVFKGPLRKESEWKYNISKNYKKYMRVDGEVYCSEKLMEEALKDNSLDQVANVASLPGIVGTSLAMPDIHWGYGFPIGGVAAMDVETGAISPGGVGYDINCGVRMLRTGLLYEDIQDNIIPLVEALYENIPSGLGSKGKVRVSKNTMEEVLRQGAKWAVENDFGWEEDLLYLEEEGSFEDAEPSVVSDKVLRRGMSQLGSLGAGNHFLEIQKISEIINPATASIYGIEELREIVVMIHTGSRGCGYQICQDQINALSKNYRKDGHYFVSDRFNIKLPDRQLVCAPVGSDEGQTYFKAMKCAANYAWANRQLITHWVRHSFNNVLKKEMGEVALDVVYDVAHNIAKKERYRINGETRDLIVHRKGATRAFGPGNSALPPAYRNVGQPVLIPGDMGTSSYLLEGTQDAEKVSFGSACHGAGRVSSRSYARKKFRSSQIIKELNGMGIYLKAHTPKVIAEEAPQVYKDIDEVVDVVQKAGIARKVAKMSPLGVVKG